MTMPARVLCSKGCGRPATRRGWCASHYMQQRDRQIASGRWRVVYTEAEPVRLHIKELNAAGLGLRRISELAGVNRKTLQWIVGGRSERSAPPSHKMLQDNADRILAVSIPTAVHDHGVANHQPVLALGTRRRLQALVAFGYPRSYLADRIGMLPSNASRLFNDDNTHVLAVTARKIADLFDELSATPGPSSRARNDAARRGWAVPMAWDDDALDDPAGLPDHGAQSKATFAEWYAELRELGYRDSEIAGRAGIAVESLQRQLQRHGVTALAEAG